MGWWPFGRKEAKPSGLVDPQDWVFASFGSVAPGSIGTGSVMSLKVPAVQSAILLLSSAVATLEVKMFAGHGKKTKELEDHPALTLLRGQANPWTSGFDLIRSLMVEALTNDQGGFAWVNRPSDKPLEIIKYGHGAISVAYAADGSGEPTYIRNGNAIKSSDVIHVRGALAHCPLSLARTAIGMASLMEDYGVGLFKNGARPGGVIKTEKKLGDEGVKQMLQGWRLAHETAENSGKTAVLWDGADFTPLSMTSTDSQYLENRKFQILEIARAFRVPPGMLYDLDRATWSNSEQMGKEFLSYSLEPWLMAVESALNRALLSDDERKTHRIRFDRDDITRADLAVRSAAISSNIQSQVMNRNEAREWLDLPPVTDGDKFFNPIISEGPLGDSRDGGNPGATPPTGNPPPPPSAA